MTLGLGAAAWPGGAAPAVAEGSCAVAALPGGAAATPAVAALAKAACALAAIGLLLGLDAVKPGWVLAWLPEGLADVAACKA